MSNSKTPSNPKTPLHNTRQEKFARGLARDLSATKAYMEAYPAAGHSAEASGSRLRKNIEVAARVDELRGAVAERVSEKSAISIVEVIDELDKIGRANMMDYIRVTSTGKVVFDLSRLTRDQAAAISEITIEEFKVGRGKNAREVRRTKFKLHDKRAALVDIGKHLGGFVERKELGGPGDFDKMGADELRAFVVEKAKKFNGKTH